MIWLPLPPTNQPAVVLVGAVILSATLAVFLEELDPRLAFLAKGYSSLLGHHRKLGQHSSL
jgi:hypothetical protein